MSEDIPSMKKLRPFFDTSIGSIAAPLNEPTRTRLAVKVSSIGEMDFARSIRAVPS